MPYKRQAEAFKPVREPLEPIPIRFDCSRGVVSVDNSKEC